ncbi:MAG: hypothetical protein HY899_11005 [Deltaproteobacteria bacterium]|nr:hypothetical protein [Deltaproteobacteria bacterium]
MDQLQEISKTIALTMGVAWASGMWLATAHPALFLVLFVLFGILLAWALPRLWHAIKIVFARVRAFFGGQTTAPPAAACRGPSEDNRPTV